MTQGKDINREIERTLASLDGVQRAEPDGFFFTRLRARMLRKEPVDGWDRLIAVITRPAIAFTAIALILGLNGTLAITQWKPSERTEQASLQQAFADEYALGINTFYDIEKNDPQ